MDWTGVIVFEPFQELTKGIALSTMGFMDGTVKPVLPEGRCHSINGIGYGTAARWVESTSFGESVVAVCGCKGQDDGDALVGEESLEEWVIVKFDGEQVFGESLPVASLLRMGVFGDCMAGGSACSHSISCEQISGGG